VWAKPPEAVDPEAVDPEDVEPEAVDPEDVEPEAVEPEAVEPEELATAGFVVVVLEPLELVGCVVVVVDPELERKEIGTGITSPARSKRAIAQVSVVCADVGGHGYLAASVALLLPALSVPAIGGPVVPTMTLKVVLAVPAAFVGKMLAVGLEQLTGTLEPVTEMVG
jgi:hypothetical protein